MFTEQDANSQRICPAFSSSGPCHFIGIQTRILHVISFKGAREGRGGLDDAQVSSINAYWVEAVVG